MVGSKPELAGSALDDAQARAPQLALEVPHADTGLLQLRDGPLVGRRVVLARRGQRRQRLALERSARVGLGAIDQIAADRASISLRDRSIRLASRSAGFVLRRRLEALSGGDPGPYRLGPALRSTSSQSTSSPGSPGRAIRISRRS